MDTYDIDDFILEEEFPDAYIGTNAEKPKWTKPKRGAARGRINRRGSSQRSVRRLRQALPTISH